ncbi:hypothetical protein GK047_02415 [Paenibacillus sp. SYP-B3998]|uniref:Uncharacterized protein n=1 Tax=Paenibacillus sp. SYP-B3998 TaxID=2678564 RepID=A0A6G3ZRN7_9BACL|nr:hypothetical protein [Paenibacillus sp. SYP-B3998]NEW04873.1 hypothetical protein [Paenibacillus sp. SYP-B3998]
MKKYKYTLVVAVLITIAALYRYIPHLVLAKESATTITPLSETTVDIPFCHIPDDGSPIVVPEQKK